MSRNFRKKIKVTAPQKRCRLELFVFFAVTGDVAGLGTVVINEAVNKQNNRCGQSEHTYYAGKYSSKFFHNIKTAFLL